MRLCPSCLTRSRGSRLPCLEGTEAGVLDFREMPSFRKAPFGEGFCKAGAREVEVVDDCLAGGFVPALTVTIFVVILGGAFFAFKAASDRGLF